MSPFSKKLNIKTIAESLKEKSNNYTFIENDFKLMSSEELLQDYSFLDRNNNFKAKISVIIPNYNSNNSLFFVLKGIGNSVKIHKNIEIECIIIDDHSDETPDNVIDCYKKDIAIKLLVNNKNYGAAFCRSLGVKAANNEIIIFIDSDTIPSSDFFFNHAFIQERLSKYKIILASFRENVLFEDVRIDSCLIDNGDINTMGDFRRTAKIKPGWTNICHLKNKTIDILKETNNWKKFGNFKKCGIWTLPMMGLTCALSCRKSMLIPIDFHPKWFHGWGFDDIAMSALLISNGAFLIPNFNSSVLHMRHSPRSGSEKDKINDFIQNRKKYNKLLKSYA